jgi:hypothetical protein
MGSENCCGGQMASENCCNDSDGDYDLLWWVRWGVRTAVVVEMGNENSCGGTDGERELCGGSVGY